MSEFIELLKVAIQFIFPHFLASKSKTETNRALELRKALDEIGHKDFETTLIKNINRKVSKELFDVELDANQIQIIEKTMDDSASEIKWKLIKDSSSYLGYSQNTLKVHFTKADTFSNLFSFTVGTILALSMLILIWIYGNRPNTNSWVQNLEVIAILIILLLFSLGLMFSTSNYFAARKLNAILKKLNTK